MQDSPHVAGDPVGAASPGSIAHSRGAPTDRSANSRYSPPPTHVALAPDCPGNRHRSAAWRAASAADAHAGTLPSRNTLDREPAGAVRMPCRTPHIAAAPSPRLRPANLGESATDQPLMVWSPTQRSRRSNQRWSIHRSIHVSTTGSVLMSVDTISSLSKRWDLATLKGEGGGGFTTTPPCRLRFMVVTRVRPRQLQRGRVDPVGTHENLSRGGSTIRKGRRHLAGGLTQLCQPAVHVHGDRARRPAVRTELEHPLIQAHQQVQPVHVMKPGAVARGGDMTRCFACSFMDGAICAPALAAEITSVARKHLFRQGSIQVGTFAVAA